MLLAKLRRIFGQKENLALIASLAALVGSYGKPAWEFLMPADQLIVIVSSESDSDNNPFPVSMDKDTKTLRLDPQLPMAFINNSSNYVLVNTVGLRSPQTTATSTGKGVCDVDKYWTLRMHKFEFSDSENKNATAFSIPPGQIVSMRIMFESIPDIRGQDTNVDKGIPICLYTELFDFKGRHHEFVTHAFQITEGDEKTTKYTSTMEDKGIVTLRFSQLWSLLH